MLFWSKRTRHFTAPRPTDGIGLKARGRGGDEPGQKLPTLPEVVSLEVVSLNFFSADEKRTSGPPTIGTGGMTIRFGTFSQAPQAVRSACSRRWDGALPAIATASWTL